ncbi:MAG: SDR family NAD(P)-dependent oxidoreductase [Bacteroidetes bacterium]|nr:SDR family NAD(P)-dependent oxidoreductase [Bacteroidota bacterium]
MDLRDKVVIITGASAGIGRATALAFNRSGAKIVLVARRAEILREIASTMHDPLVLHADLSKEEDCRMVIMQTISRFGRIDILINNAASIIVSPSEKVNRDDLIQAFTTNLLGPVTATQAVIPHMISQGGGHIINVGSPGFMMGIPYYSPYVCSKAAFSAWTRTIQAEWEGSCIRVSEYFPGYIKTNSKPESRLGDVEQDFLMNSKQNLMTRLFAKPKDPDDVAQQLVALAIKPKTLAYSDFSTRIGAFISNISPFRLAIASQMARTARNKKNLQMFNQ